jgi:hypothetical protein
MLGFGVLGFAQKKGRACLVDGCKSPEKGLTKTWQRAVPLGKAGEREREREKGGGRTWKVNRRNKKRG